MHDHQSDRLSWNSFETRECPPVSTQLYNIQTTILVFYQSMCKLGTTFTHTHIDIQSDGRAMKLCQQKHFSLIREYTH